ncbi:FAD-dependent oxidoreductase [Chromobacterium violaceum]|uniref:NAD(P)/FAD-dependent oxidoreductase n=1 Tax=Chromobacterium violaceum TaxID=536 RepID=UPI000654057A|nr:NAD(P)/FAD-dependent oxidoreductase [Chromobacterium violaceum]KMN49568.1 FAD-dependent oxidoreductase [Chromobacterium violaceum]KMN84920.1 FAD-dependent oxidoreductase [Chromobacterium violaceum]KMN89305.1 FAD-dependent oxidoreductase [Chromobacterium violaceum]KMO04755.1 FAD-dependent oxidoreductase [Chromobacterium violaceum]
MERVECVVIGAGVVGLAVARALAQAGREVVIVEAEPAMGLHASSRNSEVIHAGLYYPAGSLKARLCVAGRDALYRYCAERAIPHRRLGKLIVASRESQLARLDALEVQARANGVADIRRLTASEARALEPALDCAAALLSPSTGIVDSHALMLSLLADAEAAGAQLALASPVEGGEVTPDGVALRVAGMALLAKRVVNAAGLFAPDVARAIAGLRADSIPQARYARGVYFSLQGRAPFSRLVYPLPEAGGLGSHLTLDLAGQARFGPDVEWVDGVDYRVDPARADAFYRAVRAWWPQLPDGALAPGYAGIRAKIAGPGEPDADFVIQGPAVHGAPGLVNLFGIESPGLTSCLAIADAALAQLPA